MNRKDTTHWLNRVLLTAMGGLMAAAPQALAEGNVPDQGRRLQGTARERFERASIALSTARLNNVLLSGVALDHGEFRAQGMAGAAFINVNFSQTIDNEVVKFRITGAQRHLNRYLPSNPTPSAMVWEYKVEYSSPSLGNGPLCPGAEADQWAVAVPGVWNGGNYSAIHERFGFACLPRTTAPTVGGVAAKCVELGYTPWPSNDPRLDGSSLLLSEGDALRHHVTCTALASADYCGEARPNTLSGTPITVYHSGNVPTETGHYGEVRIAGGPVRQDYYFESAWALVDVGTGQPVTSSVLPSRVRAQAVCLTKKRWSTLPLNGTCQSNQDADWANDRLPDPRKYHPKPVHYCEDYTREELIQKGAILFSYSKFLDAALYRFKHKTTNQYLTTSQIIILPHPNPTNSNAHFKTLYQPDPSVFADAGNYELANTGLPDSYEGPLFKPNTPSHLFASSPVSTVQRHHALGGFPPMLYDQFLTSLDNTSVTMPWGYALDAIEGYAYNGASPQVPVLPFMLYRNAAGDNLSTRHANLVPQGVGFGAGTVMTHLRPLEYYAAPVPY
ncbi:hypothetical protein SAMN05444354_113184 [Stigmatella aurantiaca]|uniref:ADYC domain-containing protein n=1 Tax=Stigmatella aurantiaca TaxID=41 RepID=A0A1H7WUY2_STIAU|nr:ADYC domain-containing protein [Stigmatella aurantiaca]SEM24738.1 hypothetical protein SAMN05444354_113184 [Stigmatella aurantiaca]